MMVVVEKNQANVLNHQNAPKEKCFAPTVVACPIDRTANSSTLVKLLRQLNAK